MRMYMWTDLPSRREGVHISSFSSSVLRQPSGRLVQRADGVAPSAITVYGHLLDLKGIHDTCIHSRHSNIYQYTLVQFVKDVSSMQRVAKRLIGSSMAERIPQMTMGEGKEDNTQRSSLDGIGVHCHVIFHDKAAGKPRVTLKIGSTVL